MNDELGPIVMEADIEYNNKVIHAQRKEIEHLKKFNKMLIDAFRINLRWRDQALFKIKEFEALIAKLEKDAENANK